MITVVIGKEIEKIKGDFESYLNGLNMVGEISYSQYSELYDEGTKQIQKAYELGKAELEKENAELDMKRKAERKIFQGIVEKKNDQLTKAKEHIENLLYYVKQCTCERSNYAEIEKDIKEAEQFLKELDNDKEKRS